MKNKKSITGLVLGYIAVVVLFFALELGMERAEGTVTSIPAGWNVSCIGRMIPNQEIEDLTETGLLPLAHETEISFTHLLPDMEALVLPAVMVDAGCNALRVYLDDVLIYEAPAPLSESNAQEQIHMAGLPEDYAQKELTLTLTIKEPETFKGLSAPCLGSFEDLMRTRGNDAVVALLIGFFMMLFGLISLVILTLPYVQMKRPAAYVLSALLTCVIGFWLSMSADLQTLFLPAVHQRTAVITAMALSFVLFVFYFLTISKKSKKHLKKKEYDQMSSGEILLLLDIFGLFVILLMQTAFTVTELFFGFGLSLYLKRILPFFAALIIILRAYRYSIFVKEVYTKREENEMLFRVAYVDSLTGLYNRAGWDGRMSELDRDEQAYCIISMDLDGLKTVNDTMGHEGGDRLITGFAITLAEAFREPHFIARVGGDEFVVIMMTDNEKEVQECLKKLDAKLLALDKKENDMVHRCSYGYEFSDNVTAKQGTGTATGVKHTAHDIYMLADAKMYKIKQGHKAAKKAIAMTQADSTESKVAATVSKTLREMNGDPAEDENTVSVAGVTKPRPAEGHQVSLETEADRRKAMANLRAPIHRAPVRQEGAPLAPGAAVTAQQTPAQAQAAAQAAQIQAAARAQMGNPQKTPEQTVAQIQENEIRQVAKDAKMKKALQMIEEAQKASGTSNASGTPK